jgi:hypothetical protein
VLAALAAVGFVVALLLREVPMKDSRSNALDTGDGLSMPAIKSP